MAEAVWQINLDPAICSCYLLKQEMRLYVSPSQIDTYTTCPRKWALRYLGGIETPPNAYAQIGTEAHAEFEAWLLHGTAPTSEIVRSGLEYLPAPRTPGVETEQSFAFVYGGVQFQGYKDYRFFDEHRHLPVVGDHKTTGDLKWAKSRDDLAKDPQALVYAVSELATYPEATEVELRWTYHLRSGRGRAKPSHHVFSREEIGTAFDVHVLPPAVEITGHYLGETPVENVPQNPSGCQKYGGCPYLNVHCFPTPNERLFSEMTQSYLETLRVQMQRNGAQPAPVNPPGEALPPAPPAAPAAEAPKKRGRPKKVAPPPAVAAAPAYAPPPAAAPAYAPPPAAAPAPAYAPAAAPAYAPPPAAAPAPAYAPPPAAAPAPAPRHRIATVYIGCMPIRGSSPLIDGAMIAEAANEMLCATEKISHYKLVDFGKGPALLSVYLDRVIQEIRPNAVFIARGSFAFEDAAPTFERFADCVVRAL